MAASPPLLSSVELAAILAQAGVDFREALPEARQALADPSAANLAPLRRLFHSLAGLMPSLGLRALGFIARTGEELVLLLPAQPGVLALVERTLDELVAQMAQLEAPASPEPAAKPARLPGIGDDAGGTVLVVDDDRASALLVQASLAHLELRVVVCTSPEEALEVLDREHPDLTILDVLMPGVDGFELCTRIRARVTHRYMPVLFLSAATALEERVRGLSVGGDDFLPKPFEPAELAARVSSHLARVATMRELSIRDGLTAVFNRRYFDERLRYEIGRSTRTHEPFALAILDIDFFKQVNDRHGHQAGDAVLVQVARLLRAQFRGTDVIFRYGGEEFAVLLVATDGEPARLTVERACAAIAQTPLRLAALSGEPLEVRITLSGGVASFCEGESDTGLIGRADRALYAAKDRGRNRVLEDRPAGGASQ